MPQLKQFKERKGYLRIKAIKHLKMKMKINTRGEGRVSIYLQKLPLILTLYMDKKFNLMF